MKWSELNPEFTEKAELCREFIFKNLKPLALNNL